MNTYKQNTNKIRSHSLATVHFQLVLDALAVLGAQAGRRSTHRHAQRVLRVAQVLDFQPLKVRMNDTRRWRHVRRFGVRWLRWSTGDGVTFQQGHTDEGNGHVDGTMDDGSDGCGVGGGGCISGWTLFAGQG